MHCGTGFIGGRSVCCEANTSWRFFRLPTVTRELPCCGCSKNPGRVLESPCTSVMTSRTYLLSNLLHGLASRSRLDRYHMLQKPARDWWIPTQFSIFSTIWQISSIAHMLGLESHLFDGVHNRGGRVKIGMTRCTSLVGVVTVIEIERQQHVAQAQRRRLHSRYGAQPGYLGIGGGFSRDVGQECRRDHESESADDVAE